MERIGIRNCRGFTLFEVLVSTAMLGLLLALAGSNLQSLNNSSVNGAAQLAAFIKTVRSQAIATTSAFRIQAVTIEDLTTTYGADCETGTPHTPGPLTLQLPAGAVLEDSTWTLCFTPRGVSEDNEEIGIYDLDNQYKTIEVMLGGAVKLNNLGGI